MATQKEIKITNFGGGISDDPRQNSSNSFAIAKHFDISNPYRLTPLHGTVANETKALGIAKFLYAPWGAATTYRLYGYGVKSGTTAPALYIYDIDAGVPDGTNWATPITAEGTTNGRNTQAFFYYKDYIYMWTGTTLSRWNVLTFTYTDAYQSITAATVAQPVHHPADDIAYFFANNVVYTQTDNGTTWATALTLPDNMYIVSACAYGNYLAISCNPKSTQNGNPVTFLWDRDSSLATLTERIDMGEGAVKHIANLGGNLIAVVNFFTSNAYGLNQSKLLIKRVVGTTATTIKTLPVDNTNSLLYTTSFIRDNKLYFPAKLINDGDTNIGIYAVDYLGRINLEVIDADATSYEGIFCIANLWWLAHSGDGSVNRTVVDGTFATESIYESQKFNGGDSSQQNKLVGITVMTDPMPTTGSITLKYRMDSSTAWTTIFTHTTDNSISHSAINIEATGATLPTFYEAQFQIISTGGAIVTGFKFKYELLPNSNY